MTRPFKDLAELRGLLDALCEETITPEQMRRLEELVLAEPEAEALYVQYLGLHADLAHHFAALPGSTEQSLRDRLAGKRPAAPGVAGPVPRRRPQLFIRGTLGALGLAAGLLLALVLPRLLPRDPPPTPERTPELLDHSVAVLLQAPGATWEDADPPPRAGTPLPPGRLHLKAGSAHLEFYSGATVILSGPADVELISRTELYCTSGKLRATIPSQAQGFTVRSPQLDLIDRGTEFGLRVGDNTEVQVFRGKVELYDAGSDRKAARPELTTGQGTRLDAGRVSPIPSDPSGFPTAEQLTAQTEAEVRRRHEAWLAASRALRQDPSLVVYYPFQPEQSWSRTLLDEAGGRRQPHDGAIVGCSWVTGRWPGKQGLEFKRVSDRVRFTVPGEFDSVTLAAWVRVDGLPNRNNSLMMTDGWEEGELHWQIGETGMLILGVQSSPKGHGGHYHAPDALTPARFGDWVHLAVVYDGAGGSVTHYLDGRPVAQEPLQFEVPLRLGDVQLGNWDLAAHRNNTPIRYLSGCMDEFMLFSRALSGHEVEQLDAQGRPPP